MAKRISIKGKGADLFFSGGTPSSSPSTSSLPSQPDNGEQDIKNSSIEEMKKPGFEDMNNSSIEEMKKPGFEDIKNSSIEEMKKANKREFYKKVNYRLCPEAIESIEDTKLILQRKYQIKATYEDIAEVIIIDAYQDLLDNGEASRAVRLLSQHEDLKK